MNAGKGAPPPFLRCCSTQGAAVATFWRCLGFIRSATVPVAAMLATAALAQEPRSPTKLTLYKTVDAAACAGDTTVWLDPAAHVYYLRGDKSFGKTKTGGYNCRRQADAAGYQASKSR